jgi:DNA-binding XRE family transcriptional regulator
VNHLRKFREEAWLTQSALARRARLSVRTINAIENESYPCRNSTKAKLVRALGLPWERRLEVFPNEVSR